MRDFLSFDPKLLVYGFAILFFASFGQTFFISIYNLEIREFYILTDGEFGLVYALGTLSSSLILVGFAKLIDYIDLRIYSLIISVGLSLACLGMYSSFKSPFFLFFVIFALRFFGQGAMSHAGETTMARYFGDNRGKALSVATLGGMIGVMFLPMIVVKLAGNLEWKHIWLAGSFSILIIFLPILFLSLQNQSIRHSNFRENSLNFVNNKTWRTRDVVFDKKFYYYLPISIAAPYISTGLTFHQIFIINQKGWTIQMLASGFIFLGIFSIIGIIIGGPIVDKYNTKKVIYFTLAPLFFGILALIFFESYFFMMLYMSLLGLSLGIGTPFIGSLWAELYGLESLGSVKALLHALGVFFSALSPVVFGYMIDFGMGVLSISFMSLFIIIFSTILPFFYNQN